MKEEKTLEVITLQDGTILWVDKTKDADGAWGVSKAWYDIPDFDRMVYDFRGEINSHCIDYWPIIASSKRIHETIPLIREEDLKRKERYKVREKKWLINDDEDPDEWRVEYYIEDHEKENEHRRIDGEKHGYVDCVFYSEGKQDAIDYCNYLNSKHEQVDVEEQYANEFLWDQIYNYEYSHTDACYLSQNWDEALQALADSPYEEDTKEAYDEIHKKRNTCSCGLNQFHKDYDLFFKSYLPRIQKQLNAAPKGGYSEEDMIAFSDWRASSFRKYMKDIYDKSNDIESNLDLLCRKSTADFFSEWKTLKPQHKPTVTFIDGVLQVDQEGFVIVKQGA